MPPACSGCGRPGALLCRRCLATFEKPSADAARFLAPDAGVVAGVALELGVAAYAYSGQMRRALVALKYAGVARLAPILATAARPRFTELLAIAGRAVLTPVPVHAERMRVRGYNQARLLADELGDLAGIPVADVLTRVRPTVKQHRLNRTARLRNLREAFATVGKPSPVVVLVDDIITTTATLEACAQVLIDAGCQAVYGFAIAREI